MSPARANAVKQPQRNRNALLNTRENRATKDRQTAGNRHMDEQDMVIKRPANALKALEDAVHSWRTRFLETSNKGIVEMHQQRDEKVESFCQMVAKGEQMQACVRFLDTEEQNASALAKIARNKASGNNECNKQVAAYTGSGYTQNNHAEAKTVLDTKSQNEGADIDRSDTFDVEFPLNAHKHTRKFSNANTKERIETGLESRVRKTNGSIGRRQSIDGGRTIGQEGISSGIQNKELSSEDSASSSDDYDSFDFSGSTSKQESINKDGCLQALMNEIEKDDAETKTVQNTVALNAREARASVSDQVFLTSTSILSGESKDKSGEGTSGEPATLHSALISKYSDSFPTPLPGNLDVQIIALDLLKKKSNGRGFFRRTEEMMLSESFNEITKDVFWILTLSYSLYESPKIAAIELVNQITNTDIVKYFNRLSVNYVQIILRVRMNDRDEFLRLFPEILAEATLKALKTCFPAAKKFTCNVKVRSHVCDTIFEWTTGFKTPKEFINELASESLENADPTAETSKVPSKGEIYSSASTTASVEEAGAAAAAGGTKKTAGGSSSIAADHSGRGEAELCGSARRNGTSKGEPKRQVAGADRRMSKCRSGRSVDEREESGDDEATGEDYEEDEEDEDSEDEVEDGEDEDGEDEDNDEAGSVGAAAAAAAAAANGGVSSSSKSCMLGRSQPMERITLDLLKTCPLVEHFLHMAQGASRKQTHMHIHRRPSMAAAASFAPQPQQPRTYRELLHANHAAGRQRQQAYDAALEEAEREFGKARGKTARQLAGDEERLAQVLGSREETKMACEALMRAQRQRSQRRRTLRQQKQREQEMAVL